MTQYPFSAMIPAEPVYHVDPFDKIINSVCRHYQIPIADLKKLSRKQPLATARQWAMYFLAKDRRYTLQFIADYFGGRDHTTVIHSRDRIEELISLYPSYKETFCTIESLINNE